MLKGSLVKLITTNAGSYNALVHSVHDSWLTVTDEYGNTFDVVWETVAEFSKVDDESDEYKDFVCHQRMNNVNNEMCKLADQVIRKIKEVEQISPDLDVKSLLSMLDDLIDSQLETEAEN